MPPVLESRVVLDGLVCLFENFLFMEEKFWKLPRSIEIKQKGDKEFKGVKSLQKKTILEVKFGEVNDMPLSIIITTSNDVQRISYSAVRKIIVKGVDFAIRSLDNCPTKREWYSKCCPKYKHFINKSGCRSCQLNSNARRVVFPEDARTFGESFADYIRFKFQEFGSDIFIANYLQGQSQTWEIAVADLKRLKAEDVVEIVIHVAKDYWHKGKILLWNRKLVREFLGGGPMADFFCSFTGGHGNFVFDWATRADSENLQNIKFYSDIFKEIHRDQSPFRHACVTSILLGDRDTRGHVGIEELTGQVNAVLRSRDNAIERKCNIARVEAIISLSNEESRNSKSLLVDCRRIFDREFGQSHRLFATLDFSDFEQQVNDCLTPALLTLKSIVKNELKRRKENPMHCVNVGKCCFLLLLQAFSKGNIFTKSAIQNFH